jgi:hypothetical protein
MGLLKTETESEKASELPPNNEDDGRLVSALNPLRFGVR